MVFSILLFLTLTTVHSHGTYRAKVPNGMDSPGGCSAWGHNWKQPSTTCTAESGGSSIGSTVIGGSGSWTTSTCKADPDEDGYTNGEELGDACCYGWTAGTVNNPTVVDASKGVASTGASDGRISNPRILGSTPAWLASDLFGDGDIKKYHTAQPGAFTITTATRSVRKQKEFKKKIVQKKIQPVKAHTLPLFLFCPTLLCLLLFLFAGNRHPHHV
jgi:hypothetical protein